MFDFIRPVMRAEHIVRRMFATYEEDTIGAEIPECRCGNRSQIEVWAKRNRGAQYLGGYFIAQAVVAAVALLGLGYGAYRLWLTRGGTTGSMRVDSP